MAVSVPFRGFYLLNIGFFVDGEAGDAFPSPSGVSIFSIKLGGKQKWKLKVSVPFRGFYLLNEDTALNYGFAADKFPSPSGVSIFSILPRPARCLSLSQHHFAGEKIF